MKGMILAAGFGTRLKPLTDTVPKPAIPLLNVPLGFWPLKHLLRSGVTEVVVNTHYLPQKIVSLFESIKEEIGTLHFSHEKEKILGSAGGILQAQAHFKKEKAFWLANGDEVFLPEDAVLFKKVLDQHSKKQNLATLILMEHPDAGTKFGAVWCDSDMNVHGFGKSKPVSNQPLKPYHFTGFQILSSQVFNYIPEGESNIFYDVLVKAIEKKELISGYLAKGIWYETGNLEDLKLATEKLYALKDKNEYLKDLISHFALKN